MKKRKKRRKWLKKLKPNLDSHACKSLLWTPVADKKRIPYRQTGIHKTVALSYGVQGSLAGNGRESMQRF